MRTYFGETPPGSGSEKFAFRYHAGGGPQGMKLPTLVALPCLIGVVRDSWNQGILAVHPLRHRWGDAPENTFLMDSCPEEKHIIHLALNWREALKAGLVCSCAEIGQRVGLSGGRIRQIVRLANLHPDIVFFLKSLRSEANLKAFSEHRLRTIFLLPQVQQLDTFRLQFGAEIAG